ncbi:MAG: FkbM family methyltransferase [Patescibacteria group bacterium]
MHNFLLSLYRTIFARASFYRVHYHIYTMSLRGMGLLNSEGPEATGETHFLKSLAAHPHLKIKTILDVGANTGEFSLEAHRCFPGAKIIACEPHPQTVQKLRKNLRGKKVKILNLGLSKKTGSAKLWDFADSAPLKATQPTSTLASVHKTVINQFHQQQAQAFNIKVSTIDQIVKDHKLRSIDLLKIDAEGNELAILQGAATTLKLKKIKCIQFECNEMQPFARTFFKDFDDLLSKQYQLFRMLPNGLLKLGPYRPLTHELFGFQNIVAYRRDFIEQTAT